MEAQTDTLTNRLLEAFSWMLIHSLWQGILLAMLTAITLMLTRKLSSSARYNLVLVGLAAFVASTLLTFGWYWERENQLDVFSAANSASATGWIQLNVSVLRTLTIYFSRNAPLIVLTWCVVFLFRSVKMMRGMLLLNKIRHSQVNDVSPLWKNRISALSNTIGLKKAVTLLESGLVKVPVVIGHLKPMILMPMGLLTGLPPGQLEAVLLHELAHIRRNDFMVNFLQTLTETVFFFNPGLLWISELLREEREHCCDDLAIGQTGNRKEFVQALISFKEHALSQSTYAVAFPGKKSQMLDRVNRILGGKRPKAPAGTDFLVTISGLLLLCVFGTTLTVAQISPSVHKTKPVNTVARPILPVYKKTLPARVRPFAPDPVKTQSERDRKQALLDKKQAESDKLRADADREQAEKDKIQADKDREQAEKDKIEPIAPISNKTVPIIRQ